MPKKPSDFYFVTTNGFNDQNYVYVYNFYLKLGIEKFKKMVVCGKRAEIGFRFNKR